MLGNKNTQLRAEKDEKVNQDDVLAKGLSESSIHAVSKLQARQ